MALAERHPPCCDDPANYELSIAHEQCCRVVRLPSSYLPVSASIRILNTSTPDAGSVYNAFVFDMHIFAGSVHASFVLMCSSQIAGSVPDYQLE